MDCDQVNECEDSQPIPQCGGHRGYVLRALGMHTWCICEYIVRNGGKFDEMDDQNGQ